jgi:hypothetical protein
VEIVAKCAYFFELKALIGGRPNVVTTSLGNNNDEIDMSLLLSTDNHQASESSGTEGDFYGPGKQDSGDEFNKESVGRTSPAPDVDVESDHEAIESDEPDAVPIVPAKRKAKGESKVKTTGPRAGNSAPAPALTAMKAKKSASEIDRFTAISKAQEATEQKKLDLKRVKLMGKKEIEIASTKAKASVQIRREELKTEFAMEKLRLEHQMRMAEL